MRQQKNNLVNAYEQATMLADPSLRYLERCPHLPYLRHIYHRILPKCHSIRRPECTVTVTLLQHSRWLPNTSRSRATCPGKTVYTMTYPHHSPYPQSLWMLQQTTLGQWCRSVHFYTFMGLPSKTQLIASHFSWTMSLSIPITLLL
jgi:hypothetical protein